MKRVVLLFMLLVVLTGCQPKSEAVLPTQTTLSEPTATESSEPETTIPETTEAEPTEPETTIPEPTEPEHSDLYLPGVSVENVIIWYNEVCLDGEYVNSGDPSRVQKWNVPIRYWIYGEPTAEDLDTIEKFVDWVNTVEGFPGMAQAELEAESNLQIHFTDQQGLLNVMGSEYTNLDGAVTFWYDNDAIYDGDICIRTDLDQYLRNSVILEEIYNGLGPIQDTVLRPDSLIYQEYSQPQALTEVDELILKLLYHPDILCGMDAAACESVIRQLYY